MIPITQENANMVKELFNSIKNNEEVRQNLSKLRQEIKNGNAKEELFNLLWQQYDFINDLFESEDAKTRKNAALLIGDMELDEFADLLFASYEKETQLFVKSSYLQALKNLDYSSHIDKIKEHISSLEATELTPQNKKHIEEELHALSELLVAKEGISSHEFIGFHELSELILLTNRDHIDVTINSLRETGKISSQNIKPFGAGIRLTADCINEIMPIRTYQELLYLVPGMKTCELDPVKAAEKIASSTLLSFLLKRHNGGTPFYFRVELKSKRPLDEKSSFVKRLSTTLERLSNRELINSTTNYEFEIRLIENREGTANVMVKLNTCMDKRFAYRQEVTATSLKPVNAALLVELAKKYMIDNAQVLDPFCGVGTMLIERQKVVKANTSYGIDILGEAIDKAKINTNLAGQIIHYINKDFMDFSHEYLFDEIFTDMPFKIGRTTDDAIYDIYVNFFKRAKSLLNKNGLIIMYSHNKNYVKSLASQMGYRIIKQFEINQKEETDLLIIKA